MEDMSSNCAATTTKAEVQASHKLWVCFAFALPVVSKATVEPLAQHELLSRHDIPFEQPSCSKFKSVVLSIQSTRQRDLNRRCCHCQWRWVFSLTRRLLVKRIYIYDVNLSSKREEIFFGFPF
jgi:hypothetical protein